MNVETTENKLGVLPIGQLLLKMSVPLVLSLLIQVLYGLVDSLYVAQISNEALTAISLCTPVQYLITGIGAGIGVGTNAILSKQLGAGSKEQISGIIGNGLLMVWISSALFVAVGLAAIVPFFSFQTDIPYILDMCISYSQILCVVAFASLHQVFFERLLSATGKTNLTMVSMVAGAVINIVLDPIMIFGWLGMPALGIAGAAYATVIAQMIASLIGLSLNIFKNRELHFQFSKLHPDKKLIGQILSIGIPVAITNCMISVLAFGINNIVLPLSLVAPAVYIACIRLQSFAIMPANGMSDANVSIIAFNLGAGKHERIISALRLSIIANLVIGVIVTLAFWTFTKPLLLLFNASDEMLLIGTPALKIIGLSIPLIGISNILRGCLQALGCGRESFSLSIAQAVFLLGGAWLLSLTGNITLVWLSFPIMEVIRVAFAILFVKKGFQKHNITAISVQNNPLQIET